MSLSNCMAVFQQVDYRYKQWWYITSQFFTAVTGEMDNMQRKDNILSKLIIYGLRFNITDIKLYEIFHVAWEVPGPGLHR